jgi:hypothetical protein
MVRRILVSVLVVCLGGLLAIWYTHTSFTITRNVAVYDTEASGSEAPTRTGASKVMDIRCESPGDGASYVDNGMPVFFTELAGSPAEYPEQFCDGARTDRRTASIALVLICGAGTILVGRLIDRDRLEPTSSKATV